MEQIHSMLIEMMNDAARRFEELLRSPFFGINGKTYKILHKGDAGFKQEMADKGILQAINTETDAYSHFDPLELLNNTQSQSLIPPSDAASLASASDPMNTIGTVISGAGAAGQLAGAFRSQGNNADVKQILTREIDPNSTDFAKSEALRNQYWRDLDAQFQSMKDKYPDFSDDRLQRGVNGIMEEYSQLHKHYFNQRPITQQELSNLYVKQYAGLITPAELSRIPVLESDLARADQWLASWTNDQDQAIADLRRNFTEGKKFETFYQKSLKPRLDRYSNQTNAEKNLAFAKKQIFEPAKDAFLKEEERKRILKAQNKAFRNDAIKFGGGLAAAAGAGYGLYATVQSLVKDFSAGSFFGALGSFAGLAVSLKVVGSVIGNPSHITAFASYIGHLPVIGGPALKSLQFLTSTPGIFIIGGAIVGLAAIFGGEDKSEEQLALENLNEEVEPSVWHNGPVVMLTAGLALSSMGINLGPNAPAIQEIVAPRVQLTQSLQEAGGVQLADSGSRYGTVFVQEGANGEPTRLVYLSPAGYDSRGNVIERAQVVTLRPGMKFTAPQNNVYIPLFVKGPDGVLIQNPKAADALKAQGNVGRGCDAIQDVGKRQSCIALAASVNKPDAKAW